MSNKKYKVQIFDRKFVPGLGRGPYITPVIISQSHYDTLKKLGFTIKIITDTPQPVVNTEPKKETKIEEPVEEVVVEETVEEPVEEVVVVEETVEEETSETVDLSELTNAEIRNALKEAGVKVANNARRDKLEELYIANLL